MDRFVDGMIPAAPRSPPIKRLDRQRSHRRPAQRRSAHKFVQREPYNRAGLFEQHLVRRFTNLLGRTMWESPAGPDDPRFLVIAHTLTDAGEHGPAAPRPTSPP